VLVTGRKASVIATYDITGVSCHIGYLQGKPISAIREATMKMLALENASDYENLTFCCGRIDGGAGATSVPEHCRMQVNVRIRDLESVDSVMQLLQQQAETTYVPGTHTTLSVQGVLFPMEDREENRALCRRFSEISQSLGFGSYSPRFVGGASDAAHAAAMKIPVICASGPVVDFQHTLRERVLKASMAQRAKVHALTILELSK